VKKMSGKNFAVIGATGAVGEKMLQVLDQRGLPVAGLRAAATARSAGSELVWRDRRVVVEDIAGFDFAGVDFALFAGGEIASSEYAARAREAGAVVIDNSSFFRMDPDVPLVVPECNAHVLKGRPTLIANPNCSTIQMVVVLQPFKARGLKRVIVSTYQSVSGTGKPAIEELERQMGDFVHGRSSESSVYPHPIANNLFPHIGGFEPDGFTGEERKMIDETRKILELPDLKVSATCVRVPTRFAHAESLYFEIGELLTREQVLELLAAQEGLTVFDGDLPYPTPMTAQDRDGVQVGRVRRDPDVPEGWHMFVVADNLRKGAATNAVQIAEALIALESGVTA
jgi:aspartate-semialdehyde dehydrogenase